jgi:hypothetical protein
MKKLGVQQRCSGIPFPQWQKDAQGFQHEGLTRRFARRSARRSDNKVGRRFDRGLTEGLARRFARRFAEV